MFKAGKHLGSSSLFDTVASSLRAALRFGRHAPGFAVAAILLLALGIGANSTVFSAMNAVVLRPLPYPEADRLVVLAQQDRQQRDTNRFVAPARLEDWNRMATAFAGITGTYTDDMNETSGALPERLNAALVAPRFLQVLGVAPLLGRGFTPAEEHFGGPAAVLISYSLWQRRFGGDPTVIGKSLRFGTSTDTIVGVMPAVFSFPSREADLWLPSAPDAPFARNRSSTWFAAVGRMRPGVSVAQAQADLVTVQHQLGISYPKPDADLTATVSPLKDSVVGEAGRSLWLVYGAVTLLLLIACSNLAALLSARMAGREHEIGVRYSLGASRGAIIVQLLAEVLALALAGAVLGLGLAAAAVHELRSLTQALPRAAEISLNWQVTLYTLFSALATTLLCGLLPAVRGTRRQLAQSLAAGGRTQVSGRRPGQWVLVGVQVTLAVVLLTGAGLLLRSMFALSRVELGYAPDHVLTFHVSGSWGETADMAKLGARVDRTLDGLRSLPGVSAASTAAFAPGAGWRYPAEFAIDGHPGTGHEIQADSRTVSAGYFKTLRLPILLGSGCRAGAPTPEALVNRSFAALYLAGTSPMGHQLATTGQWFGPPALIRGVVADSHEAGANLPPSPTVYFCLSAPSAAPVYLLRTASADPASMADTVRRRIHELEPARSVYDVVPLSARIGEANADARLRTLVLTAFAGLAVLLAAIGLYGTLSYLGRLRRRETGLRLTLGAARSEIAGRTVWQGMRVTMVGCAVGWLASLSLGRLLGSMLYGVSPLDRTTNAAVIGLVLLLAAVSCLVPAWRAARTQPAETLREG